MLTHVCSIQIIAIAKQNSTCHRMENLETNLEFQLLDWLEMK